MDKNNEKIKSHPHYNGQVLLHKKETLPYKIKTSNLLYKLKCKREHLPRIAQEKPAVASKKEKELRKLT